VQECKCVVLSYRGQESAANTFALDLKEGLTVELDLVGLGFRHQITYPMLCVFSTTDFDYCPGSMPKHRTLGFQRTDQQYRCPLQARVCLFALTQNNDRARNLWHHPDGFCWIVTLTHYHIHNSAKMFCFIDSRVATS
jgi:hypothetical protein